MKNFLLHVLGYAVLALAYGAFLSLLINLQFAIGTYWLWLSFITCGLVLHGFTQLVRGGSTFDDRIRLRLSKRGFLKKPFFSRAYLVLVGFLAGLVNVIFWPIFLLSTASFSFTGRGLFTDAGATSFKMRSRQFFISSLVLMVCMAWQLIANSSSVAGNAGINKFYANMFLLGTAVWLLLSIMEPIDVASRAYGSSWGARIRVFFGCIFSFGAFVSAMALADLLTDREIPNIQAVAVEVLFGGLFSTETDAIATGLKNSLSSGSIAPILSVLDEVGFLQVILILFNFVFIAAIFRKTISPIFQAKNFIRTDVENITGAIAMIHAGNLADAETYTRNLPEWRVAPTLLRMCKLLESRSFDELLTLTPRLLVAQSVERGESLDVKELSDRERWVLLFLNMNTFFDLKDYYDFANWSIRQEYLSDLDLVQLFEAVQLRFGDENRTSMLLVYANKYDASERVTEVANRLLSPRFSELSFSVGEDLSVAEFSDAVLSAEAQKGWAVPFLRSALYRHYTDQETDKSVMLSFTSMQMLEKLKTVRSLTNFKGIDLFYLFSFLNSRREQLEEDYERLISLVDQSDGSEFLRKYIVKTFDRDVNDAVMEEQLAKLNV